MCDNRDTAIPINSPNRVAVILKFLDDLQRHAEKAIRDLDGGDV